MERKATVSYRLRTHSLTRLPRECAIAWGRDGNQYEPRHQRMEGAASCTVLLSTVYGRCRCAGTGMSAKRPRQSASVAAASASAAHWRGYQMKVWPLGTSSRRVSFAQSRYPHSTSGHSHTTYTVREDSSDVAGAIAGAAGGCWFVIVSPKFNASYM